MNNLKRFVLALAQLPPRVRSAIVVMFDLGLCLSAAIVAYWLRMGYVYSVSRVLILAAFASAAWLAVALSRDIYRSVLRFSGRHAIRELAISCAIMAAVMGIVFVGLQWHGIPRTLSVLHPLVFFMLLGGSRLTLASLLKQSLYARRVHQRKQVVIYGAGSAGQELAASTRDHAELRVVGFIDDNAVLHGRRLDGLKIWHAAELGDVLAAHEVGEVFLALPSASRARRRQIVELVRQISPIVGVRALPNIAEIASGRVSVNDLREVQIEELLGRDQVEPDPSLMAQNIRGKTVLVTGAGGSIGSELCRQILTQAPARLVLVEQSEHALYLIDTELREIRRRDGLAVDLVPKLVDVADRIDCERVFRDHRPDTVFHAAAYKHVPLVEADPIAGIRNNIVGTMACAEMAEAHGASRFILVSTDKAVRPTSVMGASKRVCELIVQARSMAQKATLFSAVRFGNVLGSSGSVVPLFRRQIAHGGPVTITHPDATRYFMTVSEAAQLVIQAGAMAEGGDIFLLDMGEPVRIRELARMMIELSGLSAADESNPDGDIEIVDIGLRPGEKVHEELLIGEAGSATRHPRIVRARETATDQKPIELHLRDLLAAIERRDADAALALIAALVPEMHSAPPAPVPLPAAPANTEPRAVPVRETLDARPPLAARPAFGT